MIELHNVSLAYQHDTPALNNVTLSIAKGEFALVTGVSGAGKSTLLKLIYAALRPTGGQVVVDGLNITGLPVSQIPRLRRKIGVVFQDFKLLPARTVLDNVALTLEVLGWGKHDINRKVYHILKQVGLEHKIKSTPLRLSGGEQQRVAMARALVNDPRIILADEPTGNLDEASKEKVLEILKEASIRGSTVVVATHDRRLMGDWCKRMIVLEKGTVVENANVA
jgi:cell division transport system ATP-binding protein